MSSFWDLMLSVVVIISNIVLYTLKLLRDLSLSVFTTKKEVVIMWLDGGVRQQERGDHIAIYNMLSTYFKLPQLYTSNLHNVIHELHLSEGKKKNPGRGIKA